MTTTKPYIKIFTLLVVLLIVLWFVNISLGSVSIPFKKVIGIFFGDESVKNSWRTIVLTFRVPKAITAVLTGSGLSICGLLMQTLFRNPLAGPYVLGISSGASLGVALLILGVGFLGNTVASLAFSSWAIAVASSGGAFLVLFAVLLTANKVRNTMSILIIGLMFGSLTAAVISALAYFSQAKQIQQYLFWSFGSLGNLTWQEITVFIIVYCLGILATCFLIKPLNSLLLGENYAKSLGVNIKKSRFFILLITSLLTGIITAFTGPIAFVGLAVPHIAKIIFGTSNHKILLPATALLGAIVLLVCDGIAQMPGSEFTLPINAVTSLFGAPIVIWLLVRKKKIFV